MNDISSIYEPLLRAALPGASDAAREKLARYLTLVAEYRRVLNLTAFSGPADFVGELVSESARLLEFGPLADELRCVDLGSGVGSPVVTLAVLCPRARFVAVEAREKRAAFLRQVAASLQLANLELRGQRAEELCREQPGGFSLVTARAFARPALLFEIAAKLLTADGELRGFFGADFREVQKAAEASGMVIAAQNGYEHKSLPRYTYCARRAI